MRITFVGHATVLIELGGRHFLTDPVFSDRVKVLSRRSKPGLRFRELPTLSAVLVSHAHYDHFDLPTLRQIDPHVPLLLPSRTRTFGRSLGSRTFVEMNHGEAWGEGGVNIHAVPARHFGGRWLLDSVVRPANGYVIQASGGTVYFAGDTARFNDFEDIGRRYTIDVALLPIGAYKPAWIMRWSHLDPRTAVEAFERLNAAYMIPIHWGTFRLSLESLEEPVRCLRELVEAKGLQDRVIVLNPGESWSLNRTSHEDERICRS